MQQLSVSLWKFNARLIESRLLLDSNDCFWDLPVMSVSSLLYIYNLHSKKIQHSIIVLPKSDRELFR